MTGLIVVARGITVVFRTDPHVVFVVGRNDVVGNAFVYPV